MRERPILLNGDMVRAVLNGSKTQTRRIIDWRRTRPTEIAERDDGSKWPWSEDCENGGDYWHDCPFGEVGDRLWVRETFRVHSRATDVATLVYKASERQSWTEQTHRVPVSVCNKPAVIEKWTPSIHMPRWASRITLEITGVRVERLQDISQADAVAEGIKSGRCGNETSWRDAFYVPGDNQPYFNAETAYGDLWSSIYGEESWQANPWVWVIEFKRVEGE
ncbi:hypothetical protein [Pantoea septica]|uniref:hypothetical protein n=1 Tax=Pantoea septica TaxID=472695 RepID=UPI002FD8F45D